MLSNWAESVGLRERTAAPQYTSSDVDGASASARAASRAEALANFDAREDDDDGADDAGGAIDKFRRRARRRSLTGTLDAGFTNFTSGIKTGWNVEAMSGKFRQAVAAEFLATMIFLFILITTVIFSFDASATSVDISLTYNNASLGSGGRVLRSIGPAPPPWLIGVSPFSHSQLVFESRGGAAVTAPVAPPLEGAAARRAQASASPSALPVTTFTLSVPGLQLTRSFFIANCAGFVVGVLVFAVGSISGANLNPAVTIGLAITQKMSSFRATCYVAAQCAGATAGSLLARSVAPNLFVAAGGGMNGASTADRDIIGTWTIMGAEILGTSVLVFTVCAAADVGREKNNKYQSALTPLMIGFAVMVSHLFLIPIDGCSINPARSFGAALAMGNFNDQWIFWFGPLLGGAGSALIYANLFSAYTAPVTMAEPKGDASDTMHAQSSASFVATPGQRGDGEQSLRPFYDASPPPTPTLGAADRNERLMVAQGQIGALQLQQGRQTWANARGDGYGGGASDAIPDYR